MYHIIFLLYLFLDDGNATERFLKLVLEWGYLGLELFGKAEKGWGLALVLKDRWLELVNFGEEGAVFGVLELEDILEVFFVGD